ncbi:MAG: hypothetical protein JXR94_01735, partial [Candidatus Hydrogenedentes bacterium]|nr:hypothetical protein [Candidatus Hydrogenedentota bacterium]
LAVHETMVGVGSFLGAIAFGILAGRLGTVWPFRWMPAFIVAAVAVQAWLLYAGRRRGEGG